MTTLAEQSAEYFNQVMNGPAGQAGGAGPAQGYVAPVAEQVAGGGFHPLAYAKSYGEIPGNLMKFANPSTEFGAADFAASLPTGAGSIAAYLAANPAGNLATSATGDPNEGYAVKTMMKDTALGAGLGNLIPIPGVGAGVGAVAGALYGGVQSVLHSRNSQVNPDDATVARLQGARDSAFSSLQNAGLSPAQLQTIHQEYDRRLSDQSIVTLQPGDVNPLDGKTTGKGGQTLSNIDSARARAFSYLDSVSKAWSQNSSTLPPGFPAADATGSGMSAQQMLALQEQTSKLMAPMIDSARREGLSEIAAWQKAATPAGQHISAAVSNLAGMYSAGVGQLTDAYKLQAQGQPFLNAVAATTYNQGIKAQNASAAGTASGGTLASVLAGNGAPQASVQPAMTATNYGGNNPLLIQ